MIKEFLNDLNLDKAEIISSEIPSARNSFSVPFDKFLNILIL